MSSSTPSRERACAVGGHSSGPHHVASEKRMLVTRQARSLEAAADVSLVAGAIKRHTTAVLGESACPPPRTNTPSNPPGETLDMTSDRLLIVARELVSDMTFCLAVTTATDGACHARVVQPGRPTADWTVDFMTNRRCRKVREIEATRRITLAYQHDASRGYVCLIGEALIVDDLELKRSRWTPAADRWNPGGPEDPAVVFVRLHTQRMELWCATKGVMPEPAGYSAAVLVRDGVGWRDSVT